MNEILNELANRAADDAEKEQARGGRWHVGDNSIDTHAFMPKLDECALLLDIDGTLLDFAPTPREVWVPKELRRDLMELWNRTDGAVAFVTGRSLNDVDLIFAPLLLPATGGHGAEIRLVSGASAEPAQMPPLNPLLKRKLATLGEEGPGILFEDKGYSLALHYRLAPDKQRFIEDSVAEICKDFQDTVEVLPGKFVVEIKQAGITKATAVRYMMSRPPFAGRHPIFIGDDVTDESVFRIIPDLDGLAFSVGRRVDGCAGSFDRPQNVRNWINRLAA